MKTEAAPVALFAREMKERMEQKDISSNELSDRIGCTYQYVRNLVTGKSLPSKMMLRAIANVLQLDPQELEPLVVKDKFRTKHGDLVLEAQGIRPDMEQIISDWADLNLEQRKFFMSQISSSAKVARANRAHFEGAGHEQVEE